MFFDPSLCFYLNVDMEGLEYQNNVHEMFVQTFCLYCKGPVIFDTGYRGRVIQGGRVVTKIFCRIFMVYINILPQIYGVRYFHEFLHHL